MGAASAALGISLIGGGTWAAFNDTATVNNQFTAGTLDLVVGQNHPSHKINFDLSNMKPGDNVERIFKLNNAGSIAIKEVLLNVTADNFVDGTPVNGGTNSMLEYLDQFVVDFMSVDGESTLFEPRNDVFSSDVTLKELVDGTFTAKVKPAYLGTGGKINLAPLTVAPGGVPERGIPVTPTDSDAVFIKITFKNDLTKDANNLYVQNKYQGDKVNFYFNLEATQWDGVHVDTSHGNGAINNGVQGSAEGTSMPNPRTIGPGTISQPVVD